MHNGELAKKYQVLPLTRKECPKKLGVMYLQTNVSHLDENIATFWVWLISSKSDDVRANAFSTSTKCKKYLLDLNVYYILISESSPYVLSYRSIYTR